MFYGLGCPPIKAVGEPSSEILKSACWFQYYNKNYFWPDSYSYQEQCYVYVAMCIRQFAHISHSKREINKQMNLVFVIIEELTFKFPFTILSSSFTAQLCHGLISYTPTCTAFLLIKPSNPQIYEEISNIDSSQYPVEVIQSACVKSIPQPPFFFPTSCAFDDLNDGSAQPASYPNLTQKHCAAKASSPIGGFVVKELKLPHIREDLGAAYEEELGKQPENAHG